MTSKDTDTSPDRQPGAPRGRVLALGQGLRTKPQPGCAYVTIEMSVEEVRRVRLYSEVSVTVVDREATP